MTVEELGRKVAEKIGELLRDLGLLPVPAPTPAPIPVPSSRR